MAFDTRTYGKAAHEVDTRYGAHNEADTITVLFDLLQRSPAFARMLMSQMAGANALSGKVQGNLAQAGAGNTGIGAISKSAGQSAGAFAQGNAMQQLFQMAASMGHENFLARMGATNTASQGLQKKSGLEKFGSALAGASKMISPIKIPGLGG